jgi:hypothetical protein
MDTLANVTEAELTGATWEDENYGCNVYWSGYYWYTGSCPENWIMQNPYSSALPVTVITIGCMFMFQAIVVGIIQCSCRQKRQPFALKLNGMFFLTGFAYFWLFFCI